MAEVHSDVKDYYGKRLKSSEDLQTGACTVASSKRVTKQVREALAMVHSDVTSKFYGCGVVFPAAVEGCRVLDLGSGSGADCYVLSKLVGQEGSVVGVDMTPEQVEVAKKHVEYHTEKFGYSRPNVDFRQGYIEKLKEIGIEDGTIDIIVSDCVINLVPDKSLVLKEAFRVLKNGGELYFSDVYSDRVIPDNLQKDKVLWGECISGALHWEELVRIATDEVGFAPPVLVEAAPIPFRNPELEKMTGEIKFCSATYRIFKMEKQDKKAEDAPVLLKYKGTIPGYEETYQFAYNITFTKSCPLVLPSSVAQLILKGRLATHFDATELDGGAQKEGTDEVAVVASSLESFRTLNPFECMASGKTSACGSSCSGSSSSSCGGSSSSKCCS